MNDGGRSVKGWPTSAPIADAVLSLSGATLSEIERATQDLSRFDARAGRMIPQFSGILLRAEGRCSSRIEHVTSSAKQIGLAELGLSMAPNARMVLANVRATQVGLELATEIDEVAIIAMHRALHESSQPGGSGIKPKDMADLVAFIARTDLPVLPQIALAHAHFAAIHPFPNGNGRTARALVQAMLKQKGVARRLVLPLSAGLLADTPGYLGGLAQYRQGDPIPIIQAFNSAAESAVTNSSKLEARLLKIQTWWHESLRGARRDSAVWRVLSAVMVVPVFDAASLSAQLDVSLRTAYTSIKALQERRLIFLVRASQRDRAWFSPEVLTALDAFAARAKVAA